MLSILKSIVRNVSTFVLPLAYAGLVLALWRSGSIVEFNAQLLLAYLAIVILALWLVSRRP